jgi:DNA (cytosine-5)-methyltransferase 1
MIEPLKVLDLFSGIGGFSLGLERAGMQTVAFCEIDPFCRRVLAKHWQGVPIYDDVRDVTAARLGDDGIAVDVICGGFPCQDISSAGKKDGLSGARSGLWIEYARIICELRPRFAIMENVSDLLSRGLGDVLGDLAALGYDAAWDCIQASDVGLPQPRDRVWVVADPCGGGLSRRAQRDIERQIAERRHDDDGLALGKRRAREATSRIRRMDDGIPDGVDRLRALGNAVVPQIPEMIGRAIIAAQYPGAEND